MKQIILGFFLIAGLPLLQAEIGTTEARPAATLLLPYFEVAPADPNLTTTLIMIGNSSADPVLAHITLWTDRSIPTTTFDVYLGGYDLQAINLRDIFNGNLPQTGPSVTQAGPVSNPNTAFPNCSDPVASNLSPGDVAHIQAAHSGQPSPGFNGLCSAVDYGDGIYRGYVTIDAAQECSGVVPGDPAYFVSGGNGIASNDNVLFGHYFLVDPANNFAQGDPLVHIEADSLNPETAVAGEYTFYGSKLHTPWSAADNREPLATLWRASFEQASGSFTDSSFLVWRDSKLKIVPYDCNNPFPNPFPLNENEAIFFDAAGTGERADFDPGNPPDVPPSDPTLFPNETQRGILGLFPLNQITTRKGAAFFNLNTFISGDTSNSQGFAQSWVTVIRSSDGRFSSGQSAVWADSATNPQDVLVGN